MPAHAPTVKLLDPGKGPRKPLRVRVSPGHTETSVLTMRMQMGFAPQPPLTLPPMVVTLALRVTDVAPDGDVHYEFEVTRTEVVAEPKMAPDLVEGLRAQLAHLVGLKGHVRVSSRGVTREADLVIPDSLAPQAKQLLAGMRESLTQISAPFPEEPVGVGARWEVKETISQQGITLTQIATYELKSLRGDVFRTLVTIVQNADRQEVAMPGLPPGAKVTLVGMDSKGTGEIAGRLDRLVPTLSTVDLSSRIDSRAVVGGEQQDVSMTMNVHVKVGRQ